MLQIEGIHFRQIFVGVGIPERIINPVVGYDNITCFDKVAVPSFSKLSPFLIISADR
jgi:hypothetical protein